MGQVLSSPETTKTHESGVIDDSRHYHRTISYGIATMQGWRRFMEDAHSVKASFTAQQMHYFGIFDGHSGGEVAKFCSIYLHQLLASRLERSSYGNNVASQTRTADDIAHAIQDSFMQIDRKLRSPEAQQQLQQLAKQYALDQELDTKVEALGRFLIDRRKRKIQEAQRKRSNSAAADQLKKEDKKTSMLKQKQRRFSIASPKEARFDKKTMLTSSPPTTRSRLRRQRSLTIEEQEMVGKDRAPAQVEKKQATQSVDDKSEKPSAKPNDAGTTALICLVYRGALIVGNAGDCRCVLSRNGRAVDLSTDHKPTSSTEYQRIVRAGAQVVDGRVNRALNLSRAIGDLHFKNNRNLPLHHQAITAFPEITIEVLEPADEFVILACDGIWECMSSQSVVDFIRERLYYYSHEATYPSPDFLLKILDELLDTCMSKSKDGHMGSNLGLDNMTAILIQL